MNIHPSLCRRSPGSIPTARALEAGVKLHGATVHFVTPALDHGPIIIQAAVPVLPGDDEATLAARVLARSMRSIRVQCVGFSMGSCECAHGAECESNGRECASNGSAHDRIAHSQDAAARAPPAGRSGQRRPPRRGRSRAALASMPPPMRPPRCSTRAVRLIACSATSFATIARSDRWTAGSSPRRPMRCCGANAILEYVGRVRGAAPPGARGTRAAAWPERARTRCRQSDRRKRSGSPRVKARAALPRTATRAGRSARSARLGASSGCKPKWARRGYRQLGSGLTQPRRSICG